MVLFTPIGISSGIVATAAGSGNVNRWTYTVPNGKRTVVTHISGTIFVTAAAANTTIVSITANIGGVAVTLLRFGNAAVITGELNFSQIVNVDMSFNDQLLGNTINNSAVVVGMLLTATLREYQ